MRHFPRSPFVLRRPRVAVLATLSLAGVTAAPADARPQPQAPSLHGRALLPADATAPAPFPGAPNGKPEPAPGATQPVGGFSALIDAPGRGRGTYWAMPDNGFGAESNSRSFLLRVYLVRPNFRTAQGGSGTVDVLDQITLRDPDAKLGFPIETEGTQDRLLTGGDLDIESFRQVADGTLWFGEEFGPFLVHTDATGKVLEAPIRAPGGVISPSSPLLTTGQAPTIPNSSGFEGMALSANGRKLHPVLEAAVTGDDPRLRRVYTFDLRTRRFDPGFRSYFVDDPSYNVADFTLLEGRRFVALERDNLQGPAARHKKAYVVRLGALNGSPVTKRLVLDQLAIADPAGISLFGARPGDIGLGDPFSMPYQTIEAVLPIAASRLAIVNDTNFGSLGRNPARPDDSDFIDVRVPGLRDGGELSGYSGR